MNKIVVHKTLRYSTLAIATVFVVLVFLTSKSYAQLAVAIVLYPILAYFVLQVFPRMSSKKPLVTIKIPEFPQVTHTANQHSTRKAEVADIDKRTFLKFVGAAGLSFFLFSLLGNRVESFLFGGASNPISAPSSTDDSVGSATGLGTDGYKISEIDEGSVTYYGFTNKNGGWLIMREDTSTSSFRYTKGDSSFSRNWSNRKNLRYDYYSNLF